MAKHYPAIKSILEKSGQVILPSVYSPVEINSLIAVIDSAVTGNNHFHRNDSLFAIRQFLKEIPEVKSLLFTPEFISLIEELFGPEYFAVKSIYFDKPEASNWFVGWHQDLTISVDRKIEHEDYGPWTVKHTQFGVQPPLHVLENIFTVRIHLDDTDENNGALKVIPGSHRRGICRPENIDWSTAEPTSCNVPAGGIMIMKPLLMHSSGRTTNNRQRRVIHLEFSNVQLHEPLLWSEFLAY